MKCPSCNGIHLKPCKYKEVTVDVCPECRGTWFDKNELNPYLSHLIESDPSVPHARAELFRTAVDTTRLEEAKRSCPRCATEMGKINYGYDSNIILDRCPQCQGVWADGGEVMRLAVFKKGNPKVNRLAKSMADYSKEELDRRAFYKSLGGLGRRAWFPIIGPKIILPLCDDLERQTFPAVTTTLIGLNLIGFSFLLGETDYAQVIATHGLVPQAIVAGNNLTSLFTYMFLHVGLIHLLGNMFFLWLFGDNVEDAFGRIGYACAYLACGLAAALLQVIVFRNSATPCVGASGAVAGIMGAYFVLYPHASVKTFVLCTIIKIPAACYLGFWFAFQILFGLLHAAGAIPGGTAWFTHIGGFLAGVILAILWKRFRKARRPLPPESD